MKIGILDLLVLMFIGLKLMGYIDWSWWWVFSPWGFQIILIVFLALLKQRKTNKLIDKLK